MSRLHLTKGARETNDPQFPVISANMPLRDKAEGTAAPLIPEKLTLDNLRRAAATGHACDPLKKSIQKVFGEGSQHAPLMLTGQQPGDKADLAHHPILR